MGPATQGPHATPHSPTPCRCRPTCNLPPLLDAMKGSRHVAGACNHPPRRHSTALHPRVLKTCTSSPTRTPGEPKKAVHRRHPLCWWRSSAQNSEPVLTTPRPVRGQGCTGTCGQWTGQVRVLHVPACGHKSTTAHTGFVAAGTSSLTWRHLGRNNKMARRRVTCPLNPQYLAKTVVRASLQPSATRFLGCSPDASDLPNACRQPPPPGQVGQAVLKHSSCVL